MSEVIALLVLTYLIAAILGAIAMNMLIDHVMRIEPPITIRRVLLISSGIALIVLNTLLILGESP